jgi:hypothetical protein
MTSKKPHGKLLPQNGEPPLSLFFAPARYKVVKIMHSCSEVVLGTTKHTIVVPSLGPSLEVITLRPAV